ncbi:hypothetical protein JKP88DRAFT_265019 [Tribonema minus]|uniref:Uncharacterized protein n=1 Tax=Tribonema minus TaxID=303371 RepID=A0A836C9U4_9STRA|nr:hypothetical protein JKP88DRAFT_265019 [Tribonema minus]
MNLTLRLYTNLPLPAPKQGASALAATAALEKELLQLGAGACRACRRVKCLREPVIDSRAALQRLEILDGEIEHVRLRPLQVFVVKCIGVDCEPMGHRSGTDNGLQTSHHHNSFAVSAPYCIPSVGSITSTQRRSPVPHVMNLQAVFESTIPNSVARGGGTSFRREDLLYELTRERSHLTFMLRLDAVDAEYHQALKTTAPSMECQALHGYHTMQWTSDARTALGRERDRMVAQLTATEMAEGILDWMLEGWHFGERRSLKTVAGFVPSIKPDGFVGAGFESDALATVQEHPQATQDRLDAEESLRQAYTLPPDMPGSHWAPSEEKVVKPGSERDKAIAEAERAVRFGLFCLTIMFFRSRYLLKKRMEAAQQFERDANGPPPGAAAAVAAASGVVLATAAVTGAPAAQPGSQRVARMVREERQRTRANFAGSLRQERKEREAALLLQRAVRGHIGRKAGRRWLKRRRELLALNALMHAAALALQRVFRGWRARRHATAVRVRLAKWVMAVADEEAEEFRAAYADFKKKGKLKKAGGGSNFSSGGSDFLSL